MKYGFNLLCSLAALLIITGCGTTATTTTTVTTGEAGEEILETIELVNRGFEEPNAGKQTSFDTVPGWSTDTPVKDSGVEAEPYLGDWSGYLMAGDPPVYNDGTGAALQVPAVYKLEVASKTSWQGKLLQMIIYGDIMGVQIPLQTKTVTIYDSFQLFSMYMDSLDAYMVAGNPVTVGFENVTYWLPGEAWLAVDAPSLKTVSANMEADNLMAKIAGMTETPLELPNAGFEDPNDGRQANFLHVPGWASLNEVTDSGVEGGYADNGGWAAYLMAGDGPVFSTHLDNIIEEGAVYKLTLKAKATWQGVALTMGFAAIINGAPVALATKTVGLGDSMVEHTHYFDTADCPMAAGNPITVGFMNYTLNYPAEAWLAVDDVKLSVFK